MYLSFLYLTYILYHRLADLSIGILHKLVGGDLSTIDKSHIAPTEYGDLVMRAPNLERLTLGVYSVALVDIPNTIAIPHATVATVRLNGIYGASCCCAFHALGGDLIACLIAYRLSLFESQAVVVFEFKYRANVNHSMYLSFPFLYLNYTIKAG